MKILVNASPLQFEQLMAKGIPAHTTVLPYQAGVAVEADVYFDLVFENETTPFAAATNTPIFVNAVVAVGSELPANYIRINAWATFFERPVLEIAATNTDAYRSGLSVLDQLGWKYEQAPDEPGMIAARVVAMIINEAYYALDEKVSTQHEMDTAMRLGTNYPLGPFEWAEKIGLKNICRLLKKLGQSSPRYKIAPGLETAAKD